MSRFLVLLISLLFLVPQIGCRNSEELIGKGAMTDNTGGGLQGGDGGDGGGGDGGDDGDGGGNPGGPGDPGNPGNPGDPGTPPGGPTYRYFPASDLFNGSFTQSQDFLFVVDNSGSMSGEINTVKNKLNDFVSLLDTRRQVDYQWAIVTTDVRQEMGALRSSGGVSVVKRASTPDPVAVTQSIIGGISANGGGDERGYQAARMAITNSGSLFMRPEVPLAVIIMSDEEDHSCTALNRTCSPTEFIPVQDHVNYFKALSTQVLLYPIVGVPGITCNNVYEYGPRYVAVQEMLGAGASLPICENQLATQFASIASTISGRGICYKLSKEATGKDIAVAVEGLVVPASADNGYRFEAGTNSICFSGNFIPGDGQIISVNYEAREIVP